ncbi:hypothetical protein LTR35_000371 [Friedmanniomyces endolithicus]|uniref:F-box domain-containing protein n=1 Tax=Friedmanniomyces endolithicus TaxID=329885 RepID=A0AAN6FVR5_9PEZI|nr:hypothetical protein LTS00_013355 [Friedmanniomyces endolithicus]KAK0293765.1 hypothetical protein LTR35_000371 [Friedmanniomyces endolithicus]KAK0324280.1 hypothetical protein LTR82_004718 [Friedmanniomyces endolithicus]KAK0985923.1 hypothetical protein LTR54_013586 [Friedmanniomyces endolithicus]
MEAVPATVSSILAAPLVEATHPASYDDDARHHATPISQVLKSAASIPPPQAASPFMLDGNLRDGKTLGTRFHEDCYETDLHSPRLRSSRLYKGKGKDAVAIEREQKKPLRLLDLPLDILKDIVREVTHTNDLTSLALCHSALHGLAIPHIYSRFDIVWPDTSVHSEPRSGVDALTYGLATLVMAEEIFGEARNQRPHPDKNRFARSGHGRASETQVRRRRGNHYARYTRKFSLGNGPPDWVQEYLITKEGGKMLGTLVALAVARMHALETFIWDMPTGILRDVWLALSSLDDCDDDGPCRLERVWVRWHDNCSGDAPNLPNPIPPPPPAMHLNGMIPAPPQSTSGQAGSLILPLYPTALDRVEHPSFSVLPALKSLSVLDVDELAYLDEMAVLIGRSVDKLRELRVGIARHARSRTWATVWEGDDLPQVDHDYPTAGSLTIGEKRNGGVLGALAGFVCDMRRPKLALYERARRAKPTRAPPPSPEPRTSLDGVGPIVAALDAVSGTESVAFTLDEYGLESEEPGSIFGRARSTPHGAKDTLAAPCVPDPLPTVGQQASPGPITPPETPRHQPIFTPYAPESVSSESGSDEPPPLNGMLHLDCLELERVPLSIPVLQRVIDWTRLTSLTLLHCQNHEQLWKTLRRTYAPMPKSPTYPQPRRTSVSTPRKGGKLSESGQEVELEYTLKLKKIHTNNVSPALLSFLKETLAPNSLEVLFLQEAHSYSSSVTVDLIYRGPIKRHRTSLKKVLIDSSEKGLDGLPTSSSKWRRWMLSREVLAFMCSGKMPALRELGMALDYRDWHFFLQHLPYAPHLRSLYIPFLADHIHGPNVDPKELAAQIVDVVVLRPEVELCYMGIANKCYEILENRRDADGRPESHLGMAGGAMIDTASDAEDDEEEEDGEEDEEDEEVEVEEETESDEDEEDGDDSDSEGDESQHAARLRLREILFYDDKVAVFKARHGRL